MYVCMCRVDCIALGYYIKNRTPPLLRTSVYQDFTPTGKLSNFSGIAFLGLCPSGKQLWKIDCFSPLEN
jgi:hypothetical protein